MYKNKQNLKVLKIPQRQVITKLDMKIVNFTNKNIEQTFKHSNKEHIDNERYCNI